MPVRNVMAPPQVPHTASPVSKIGPVMARGGTTRGLRALAAADVGKAQEVQGFRFAEPAPISLDRCKAAELDQAGLLQMQRQRELLDAFAHSPDTRRRHTERANEQELLYFHGARGAFLLELGRKEEARVAFDRAIALANTPAEAAHIRQQIDRTIRESDRVARGKCSA